MEKSHHKVYCVVAACCSDIEQREILTGIISTANQQDIDIVVLSNIYNPNVPSEVLKIENNIYNLICSDLYDGFILISESFINPILQQQIKDNLYKMSHIPIIVIGTVLPDFELPNFHFINSDDEKDIESITEHLIEVHHCRNIDILSGFDFIDASHLRVNGYKHALERHKIPYKESHVLYGDFWMMSGEKLAKEYIEGKRPYPDALVCCNDYMAYGVLDTFMDANINIQDKMKLIGYEYIRERRNHYPVLTTFQRNRKGIGEKAIELLNGYLETGSFSDYTYPIGKLICGETCGCGLKYQDLKNEIHDVQTKETYSQLSLVSQMEHRLTECKNLDEFITRCWDFQYLIRNVSRQYLCLYDDWFHETPNTEQLTCYSLLGYEKPFSINKTDLSPLMKEQASCYYCSPLFFDNKELGFVILSYHETDVYDPIYRNWLKSLANGLKILSMKNDIRYLTACQNLSNTKDSLTGFYTKEGLIQYFSQLPTEEQKKKYFLKLELCTDPSNPKKNIAEEKINVILNTVKSLQLFAPEGIFAHIDTFSFVGLIELQENQTPELLQQKLYAVLYQQENYIQDFHTDSITLSLTPVSDQQTISEQMEQKNLIPTEPHKISSYYHALLGIRDQVYQTPEEEHTLKAYADQMHVSQSHFRLIYRECFPNSLKQDMILSKIYRAIFLFLTTSYTATEIAEQCGYNDEKYFLRQFTDTTGLTTKQYKKYLS